MSPDSSPHPWQWATPDSFPTEWHARHNIPYVTANLIALKDPMPRNGGAYFWLVSCFAAAFRVVAKRSVAGR